MRKGEGVALDASPVRVPEKLLRLAVLALGAAVFLLQLVDARNGWPWPMQDVLDEAAYLVVAVLGRVREKSGTTRQPPPLGSSPTTGDGPAMADPRVKGPWLRAGSASLKSSHAPSNSVRRQNLCTP